MISYHSSIFSLPSFLYIEGKIKIFVILDKFVWIISIISTRATRYTYLIVLAPKYTDLFSNLHSITYHWPPAARFLSYTVFKNTLTV